MHTGGGGGGGGGGGCRGAKPSPTLVNSKIGLILQCNSSFFFNILVVKDI